MAFDNDFRVATTSVNGTSVSYGYDADSLLTQTGALTLTRAPATGRISSTTLGAVSTSLGYTTYGELETVTATAGAALYAYTLHRDLSGRIDGKTETVQGVSHAFGYAYDAAGRLESVTRDGQVVESFSYDDNGNRLSRTTAGGTEASTVDDQDRLRSAGATSFTYGPAGDLRTRTVAGQVTTYSYDAVGNLLAAWLPGGQVVEYVTDPLHRRVGKKVDGALVEAFLYDGQLRPVAWLNGAGQVYARFVYGTRVNVPEYMVTAAGTYRILTDHLGSPRLVVDAATGAVAQRIDYDAWGQVLADTSPGFQPFGFAGGLWDRDTGLVRFGARDYDPAVGRWTNKDPIRFNGGDTNIYAYSFSDPVNLSDPSGLVIPPQVIFAGLGFIGGFAGTLVAQAITGQPLDFQAAVEAGAFGAMAGALAPWAAVTRLGAALLAAAANVGQYAYQKGGCGTAGGYAWSAVTGLVAGAIAGPVSMGGIPYATNSIAQSAAAQQLGRDMNRIMLNQQAVTGANLLRTFAAGTVSQF